MIEKLKKIKERYNEIMDELVKPEVISNILLSQKLAKERAGLEDISNLYDRMEKCLHDIEVAEKELKTETDEEMIEMYKEEVSANKACYETMCGEARILLLPKDENDEKNVIMELRAGAGGDEAGIFAKDLMKMYIAYAEKHRWKVEITDINETELGGIKDATMMISGKGAFAKLKYESGVHRVQRVPETESQGRIHTSTATVAVLPEEPEVEFEINEKDVRLDTYRSSGAGGQHVNKTDSAIRLTHIPTGIVVACQDERSQTKNKERAFSILKSKLYDYYQSIQDKQYASNRRIQIGSGDRSEKIRTYNWPQSRIVDHRIGYTTHDLLGVMAGNIDDMISELTLADQRKKLENATE